MGCAASKKAQVGPSRGSPRGRAKNQPTCHPSSIKDRKEGAKSKRGGAQRKKEGGKGRKRQATQPPDTKRAHMTKVPSFRPAKSLSLREADSREQETQIEGGDGPSPEKNPLGENSLPKESQGDAGATVDGGDDEGGPHLVNAEQVAAPDGEARAGDNSEEEEGKDGGEPRRGLLHHPGRLRENKGEGVGESRRGAGKEADEDKQQGNEDLELLEFSFKEIEEMTGNFSELLGEGELGSLYKGRLRAEDRGSDADVAVKVLKRGSAQDDEEWKGEVRTLWRLQHKHLVAVRGFTCDGLDRAIVYEYVPNGGLVSHILWQGSEQTEASRGHPLSFRKRLKALQGTAEALLFLNKEKKVSFRDFWTADILVDNEFHAKLRLRLSDFGLHRAGTYEGADFLAPEYVVRGKATEKSDVYSFGVAMIEVLTGRKASTCPEQGLPLIDWAIRLGDKGSGDDWKQVVDPRLKDNFSEKAVKIILAAAKVCVAEDAPSRPSMARVKEAVCLAYKHTVLECYTRQRTKKEALLKDLNS